MQKVATKVFVGASVAFGILGVLMVLFEPDNDSDQTSWQRWLMKAFFMSVFVILTSFALSVASKYLQGNGSHD